MSNRIIQYTEWESISRLNEDLEIVDGDLRFVYDKSGATKLGKGKSPGLPFIMKSKETLGLPVLSVYYKKSITTELKAIKRKNDIKMDEDEYQQFINRTGLLISKWIRDRKTDVLVTPSSSSVLLSDIINNVIQRSPGLKNMSDSFQKVSPENIKNIKINYDDPRINDKIIKSLESILRKAEKDGYFELKKVDNRFRKFLSGYYETVDQSITRYFDGKNVVVLDDTISTGSTMVEIFRTVSAAGAESVYGITMFKT